MCLGCICYGKGESLPRASRIERAPIVPGTKQSEDLTSIVEAEQAIDLVQPPTRVEREFSPEPLYGDSARNSSSRHDADSSPGREGPPDQVVRPAFPQASTRAFPLIRGGTS